MKIGLMLPNRGGYGAPIIILELAPITEGVGWQLSAAKEDASS
ncbi:hypothetical protein ACFLXB_08645 [Chloroflexota bacterium]